jgi:phospholipid-binding lipoprotein MlaA
LLAVLLLSGCAHRPADDPADPLENVNRAMWSFDEKADKYVLRPVAVGYVKVTPNWMRRCVANFLSNVTYTTTIVNDLFQLKMVHFASDIGRFVFNSAWGVGGLFDPATNIGLVKHDEDFGQTLGYWGMGEGWFLMLPFFGPSDNRDLLGKGVDIFTTPTHYLPGRYDLPNYMVSYVVAPVSQRAGTLSEDSLLNQQFDTYLFVRTAYLQRRQALIYDGNPPPESYDVDTSDDSPPTKAPAASSPKKKQ